MRARVVRFPSYDDEPRLPSLPGRVRRFSFYRMRVEVWLRVVLWRFKVRRRRR